MLLLPGQQNKPQKSKTVPTSLNVSTATLQNRSGYFSTIYIGTILLFKRVTGFIYFSVYICALIFSAARQAVYAENFFLLKN